MWERMIPTIEQIRKLCTESSFERGIEYFPQGSVRGLEQFGNRISATVTGTNDEVDFSYIRDLAGRYMKAGSLIEAATVYRVLSEVIAENMEGVDDSDGYYGGEFSQAMEDFLNCINRAKLSHKEKKGHIGYLFGKYIENEPDYLQEYYDYALREICQSRDDLEEWKRLLKPHLPEDLPEDSQWHEYYQAKEPLGMQLHILDLLDDEKGFYDLIQRWYGKDHEFCLLYASHLEKDGKRREAVRAAEEGLRLFPEHLTKEIRRFLNRFYEGHSPQRHKQNLITLFIQDRDWDDYERLKELCCKEEWKKVFCIIINGLSKGRFGSEDTIISIYLREGMFEQALN